MNNAPCRDCVSREVGCHAGCERYKAYADGRRCWKTATQLT